MDKILLSDFSMTRLEKFIGWVIVFAIVFALAFGCKSVKKSKSSSSQSSTEKVTTKNESRDTTSIVTASGRTLDTEIKQHVSGELVIYPRGEFTVGPDGTFKGQADSVVSNQTKVHEETRSERDTLQNTESSGSQTTAEAAAEKSDDSETNTSNTERKPSIIPWIGAALGIIILAIGLHLYFRKKARL